MKKKQVKRRVLKCDKYGKVLKECRDVDDAALDAGISRSGMYNAIWSKGMTNGFKWLYKNNNIKKQCL